MMQRIRWLLVLLCLGATSIQAADTPFPQDPHIQQITYINAGNYKAWVSYPEGIPVRGVIIYNYDEYWDWAQNDRAMARGYDLKAFMHTFNKWGYICMIPIERYRKINALKGAVEWAKTQSDGGIHLVGLSEGAFLSLLIPDPKLQVASITLLSPSQVHTPFALTRLRVPQQLRELHIPVLYIATTCDPMWKMNTTYELLDLLKKANVTVKYSEYAKTHIWFWNPENDFMQEIYEFITGERMPIKTLL